MTWFRRHWPDLLIIFFILLILAGAALILFGGTKRLFSLNSAPQVETQAPQVEGVEEIPLNPAPSTEATEPEPEAPVSNGTQAQPLSTQPQPTEQAAPGSETTQTVPVIPAQNPQAPEASTSQNTPPAQTNAGQEGAGQAGQTTAPAQGSTTTETPEATPSTPEVQQPQKPVVNAVQGRAPTKQDYRISAGLYSTEAQATAAAAPIKALGYPTHVFPSKDDTFVVLIGPFVNRADADAAVGQIQAVHQNLFVYAPQNPVASTTPETPSAAAPAPSNAAGSVFLQVGAYKRADSAVPAIDQLKSLGFNPSLRTDPNGMVRLIVGPYSADGVSRAQDQLKQAGFADAFQTR